eukprot:950015-Alexandrium_andersonii.AAC.1
MGGATLGASPHGVLLPFDPRGSFDEVPGSNRLTGGGVRSSGTRGGTPSGRSESAPSSSAPSPPWWPRHR